MASLNIKTYLSTITIGLTLVGLSSCGGGTSEATIPTPHSTEVPSLPQETQILRAGKADGERYFTNEKGEKLFNGATFYNTHDFHHGYCVVSNMVDGKELRGVINAKGETVVEIKYPEFIKDYTEGYFEIRDTKVGYLDSTGKMVIPKDYTSSNGIHKGLFTLEKGINKWGILNTKGETIVPFEYQKIQPWSEDLAAVKKGNKWGYVNAKGELVIPCTYESTTGFDHGVAFAQKGNKYGLIDAQNAPVTEFVYDEFKWVVDVVKDEISETGYSDVGQRLVTEDGYIVVSKGKLWGAIDTKGQDVIPFEFDYVGGKSGIGVNVGNGKKRGVYDLEKKAVKWLGE